ncbi:uncharacterized protein [Lepisosteus oculatus]|uniref:uncharacterized protein isoform X2 n=1 Tax=Lepisosteus oculatus TaxID=7918 RepID=UPI000740081C|nr:PREDICTED: uncharacterized protein LOC107077760 isoform X2 [Lepisosteus oculatus]XP_015205730.1 PREDICTED: uncharacterized protein LOC107077760 isoform X2 [Lepisosteus oculatus]
MCSQERKEKCKVESSTDSESDTSPEGCASSTPESGATRKVLSLAQQHRGRSSLPSWDPYDGSSEDSSDTSRCSRSRIQGGSGLRSRTRSVTAVPASSPKAPGKRGDSLKLGEIQLPSDVQMKSSSDSEVRFGEPVSPRGGKDWREMPVDSGVHTEASLSTPGQFAFLSFTPARLPASTSYRSWTGSLRAHPRSEEGSPGSPEPLAFLPKRKSGFPGAESGERCLRKKQRTVELEDTE